MFAVPLSYQKENSVRGTTAPRLLQECVRGTTAPRLLQECVRGTTQ